MDFRVFLVVAIEVEKGGQVKMVENGRKWQAIDFHGYLVGNGFPRVLRHSPTTISQVRLYSRFFILIHSILIISVFINEP